MIALLGIVFLAVFAVIFLLFVMVRIKTRNHEESFGSGEHDCDMNEELCPFMKLYSPRDEHP